MKRKTVFDLIIIVLSVILLAVGAFVLFSHLMFDNTASPTEIKKGFSPKLLSDLKDRYGITIPKEASFIKGYNDNDFREGNCYILFECPADESVRDEETAAYIIRLLGLDSTRYSYSHNDIDLHTKPWFDEADGQLDHMLIYNDRPFTYISYSFKKDKVLIRFKGWRPRYSFP